MKDENKTNAPVAEAAPAAPKASPKPAPKPREEDKIDVNAVFGKLKELKKAE